MYEESDPEYTPEKAKGVTMYVIRFYLYICEVGAYILRTKRGIKVYSVECGQIVAFVIRIN